MRILFTIPHYYNPKGGGAYGSLKANAEPRRAALAGMIRDLHATFGRRQVLLTRELDGCNAQLSADITVAVCTTRGHHLLDGLPLEPQLYRHVASEAEPLYLGFQCHAVLRDNLGRFDYFCYLEDDLSVLDPLFFQKLEWFNRFAGDEALLQPNRFEVAAGEPVHKLYIDGGLARREWSERWQNVAEHPVLEAEAFGVTLRFRRVNNPHSGCFFLNARQMERWARQSDFLERSSAFAGPLESAATLGVMRHFRVYKPARGNAGFLELRHLDNRYLGARLKLKQRATTPAA
jgi:hypothetical protein